jgi:hypothetical protein
MGMTSMPGNQSGGMGGKSMGGPNTSAPGGGGNDYNGNPNYGGMPTQFSAAGPGMGVGMDYRNLGGNPGVMGGPDPLPSTGMGGGKSGGPVGGFMDAIGGKLLGRDGFMGQLVGGAYGRPIFGGSTQPIDNEPLAQTAPDFNTYDIGPGPTGPSGNPSESYMPPPVPYTPAPIFGGGQQQPITQGTGQLPPGFGALSPIDRSQIGNAQIGMTNRFAPPNAPGVRRAQPLPAPARVPAARVSNANVNAPARVAKPITRTRSR